jgi:hypothetical protein
MRTFFTLLLIATLSTLGMGQTNTPTEIDARLFDVYEADYLENLLENNPFLIQRWNFFLDNSYYIMDLAAEKGPQSLPVIQIDDLENLNILLLQKELELTRQHDKMTAYKIAGTDKALVFRSGKEFTELLNKHLGR